MTAQSKAGFVKTCQNLQIFQVEGIQLRLSCVKGNPGLTQNLSILKKDITKVNACHMITDN